MPELPEVETVRRQLAGRLTGAKIVAIEIWRSGREFPAGQRFVASLVGQQIHAIDRRAKLLIWRFKTGQAMTAHLKMTGRFVFVDDTYHRTKHDRALFTFAKGRRSFSLIWADVRQFGFLKLVDKEELRRALVTYGPEPLDVEAKTLADCLPSASRRSIKAVLLDQTVLAGIGNIYADEALYRAGIRPTRRLSRLSKSECLHLAKNIQRVLQESIDQQGTSANDYVDTEGKQGGFLDLLRVYGRADKPCLTCRTPIKKIVLAARGTHYCPKCQA